MKSCKISNKLPSLVKVLVSTFWPEYLFLGSLLSFMEIFMKLGQPIMLGLLLDYFQPNSTTTKEQAFWYAGGVIALNGMVVLLNSQFLMNAYRCGMKIRVACCTLIYRKVLNTKYISILNKVLLFYLPIEFRSVYLFLFFQYKSMN